MKVLDGNPYSYAVIAPAVTGAAAAHEETTMPDSRALYPGESNFSHPQLDMLWLWAAIILVILLIRRTRKRKEKKIKSK
jgi:hypothetical protein